MKREEQIRGRFGKANPYRVPEGYFEGFASQLMDKLPERAPVVVQHAAPMMRPLRRWLCAAACLCVLVMSAAVFMARGDRHASTGAESQAASLSISAFDLYEESVADYAMMDNADIYAYLADDYGD